MCKHILAALALLGLVFPLAAVESQALTEAARWSSFKTSSGVETRFAFQNDAFNLYLKVICLEPEMGKLRRDGKVHDVDVWKEDNVEIFINPLHGGSVLAQFVVGASGCIYDSRIKDQIREPNWNPGGVESKVVYKEDRWEFELRLPLAIFVSLFSDLEAKSKIQADTWSFNLVRNRISAEQKEVASYSDCSHWLDVKQYARLEKVNADYQAMYWGLSAMTVSKTRMKNQGFAALAEATIDNLSGKMRSLQLEMRLQGMQKEEAEMVFEKKLLLDQGQIFKLREEIDFARPGMRMLELSLRDLSGNLLSWDCSAQLLEFVPMRLEIVSGAYRGRDIFASMQAKQLQCRLFSSVDYQFGEGEAWRLELFAPGREDEPLVSMQLPVADAFRENVSISLPELSPGQYYLKAAFVNPEMPEARTAFYVHPKGESEVYVNENLNFVLNGSEFFPIGGFGAWWLWEQYPGPELIDYSIAYGPAHELGESEASLYADAEQGWRIARYPEPPDLWSHPVSAKGAALALRPIPPENAQRISSRVDAYRGKDHVFGWYLADEPSLTKNLPLYLEQINALVNKHDPYHPTLLCFNASSSAEIYKGSCDAAIIDYFPGFHESGKEQSLSSFVTLLADSALKLDNKIPLIAAPPLYAYAGSGRHAARFPNYLEQRCMSFSAMTCDAVRGFCWNDVSRIGACVEMFFGVPAITVELRKLERVWLSRDLIALELDGVDAASLQVIAKDVAGKLYMVAVNPTDSDLQVNIRLPQKHAEVFKLAVADRQVVSKAGVLALKFAPLQVRIFSDAADAPVLDSPDASINRIADFVRGQSESGNLCHLSRGPKLLSSPLYAKTFSLQVYRDWLFDGLLTRTYRVAPQPKLDVSPWLGVEFAQAERISKVQLAWKLHGDMLPDENIAFRLEFLQGDSWVEAKELGRSIEREQSIIVANVDISQINSAAIRVQFLKADSVLLSPCEIKAFE